MEPIKEYSKTELTLENLVIPDERLLNTPSAKDGMPRDVEVNLRVTGCEYIQSAGLLLRLPQVSTVLNLSISHFYISSLPWPLHRFSFIVSIMPSLLSNLTAT